MNRAVWILLLTTSAGLAQADPVVRHATFCGGVAVAGGAGRVLGISVGQCFTGAAQGAETRSAAGFWSLVGSVGAGPGGSTPLESDFLLAMSAPNPFRHATALHFALPEAAWVALLIHDAGGREVRRLLDSEVGAGPHDVVWDGRDDAGRLLPGGIYFCRIHTRGFSETRKLIRVP